MADASETKTYKTLNNGYKMPCVGLGLWQGHFDVKSNEKIELAVGTAIDAGYRHIDGAQLYATEKGTGDILQKKFSEGVVKRADLFITGKLWNTFHRPEYVRPALMKSLQDLQIANIDLYLIHWPVSLKYKDFNDFFPTNEEGKLEGDDVDYIETWKEMEKLVDEGLVRSIGVSNFTNHQTQRILDMCRIKPAVNQIEVHPYIDDWAWKVIDFCKENEIVVTAFSPFGSPTRPQYLIKAEHPNLFEDPVLKEIAARNGKTIGQITLRYLLQCGLTMVPKSVTPSRIRENLKVFDFTLSEGDMDKIRGLRSHNFRAYPFPEASHLKYFPF